MKKQNYIWWAVTVCLLVFCASVFAQATNTPPAIPGLDLPVGKEGIWFALIPPITFTITWLVGKIPPLPKQILPWITPVAGIAIGAVIKHASNSHWAWWSSAGAGAVAVAIYEAAKGLSKADDASPLTPTPKVTTPGT